MSAPASAAGSRLRTLDLTYTALFAVLMAVCAWISIPVPKPMVPFSMQTFAVFAALAVLGGRRGTYAVSAYLLLGAVGLPVFAGFRGGLSVLLGSTGGYLIGFMGTALVFWLMESCLETACLSRPPPACWGCSFTTLSAPPGSWWSTPGMWGRLVLAARWLPA